MASGTTAPAVTCQVMNNAAIIGSPPRQDLMFASRICLSPGPVKLSRGFGIRGSGFKNQYSQITNDSQITNREIRNVHII